MDDLTSLVETYSVQRKCPTLVKNHMPIISIGHYYVWGGEMAKPQNGGSILTRESHIWFKIQGSKECWSGIELRWA